jgi:hypothetical protein
VVSGEVDVPPGNTLLLAQRRTAPTGDPNYYFAFGAAPSGVTGRTWSAKRYFGDAPPQSYEVILLIVNVDVAKHFWDTHLISGGGSAVATSLPAPPADTVKVRQTSMDPC